MSSREPETLATNPLLLSLLLILDGECRTDAAKNILALWARVAPTVVLPLHKPRC